MLRVYLRLRNEAAGLVLREHGQTLTEYALILMLIALAVVVAVGFFGTQLNALWSRISTKVGAAAS